MHSGKRVEFSRGRARREYHSFVPFVRSFERRRRRRLAYIESVYRHAVRGYAAAPRCRGETQVTPTGRDATRAERARRSHPRLRPRRRRVNTEGYATRQHVDHDARVDGRRRSPADASSGKSCILRLLFLPLPCLVLLALPCLALPLARTRLSASGFNCDSTLVRANFIFCVQSWLKLARV